MTLAGEQVYYTGMLMGVAILIALIVTLLMRLNKVTLILQHNESTDLRLPFQQFAISVAQNADLASVYYRGLQGFTGLSAEEQVRFFMIATLVFNYWNEVYDQTQQGVIPPATWERAQKMMRDFVRYPGIQQYWEYRRHWYAEDLQNIVNGLIRESGQNAPSLYPEPSA